MEAQIDDLALSLLRQLDGLPSNERLLIGISGIPGSGKTTLTAQLSASLNRHSASSTAPLTDLSIVLPMDGFHLPRSVLATSPNPKLAFDRRGAEFTFDSSRFAEFVAMLRSVPSDGDDEEGQVRKAPSFDHALKDPVEGDIRILPRHRVVLVEGLYCNCSVGEWGKAAGMFHQRWVCKVDREVARDRLVQRHVRTGVAKDKAEARWRVDTNDLPNGDWLLSNLLEPYTVIDSIEDATWS